MWLQSQELFLSLNLNLHSKVTATTFEGNLEIPKTVVGIPAGITDHVWSLEEIAALTDMPDLIAA